MSSLYHSLYTIASYFESPNFPQIDMHMWETMAQISWRPTLKNILHLEYNTTHNPCSENSAFEYYCCYNSCLYTKPTAEYL